MSMWDKIIAAIEFSDEDSHNAEKLINAWLKEKKITKEKRKQSIRIRFLQGFLECREYLEKVAKIGMISGCEKDILVNPRKFGFAFGIIVLGMRMHPRVITHDSIWGKVIKYNILSLVTNYSQKGIFLEFIRKKVLPDWLRSLHDTEEQIGSYGPSGQTYGGPLNKYELEVIQSIVNTAHLKGIF
ncbi:hypothetical protein HYY71_02585 [Candidatus Woesearchaeota archaeon]|nr:hypothetical protein [Candidatus Woesearchaeota archaeon]